MNILITGGTGLIGRSFIHALTPDAQVILLTRSVPKAQSMFKERPVLCVESLDDVDFNNIDAIINLAGESIGDRRWSESQKEKICQSRWQMTSQLNQAINSAEQKPQLLISGSAIGYYGRQGNQIINEDYQQFHDEFTHQVCAKWEELAFENLKHDMRVCVLRTGVVLSREGGALPKMAQPFKLGVGAVIGDGQQVLSWIHIDDMVAIILALLNENYSGVIHATAPGAVTNQQFSNALAKTLHRPCWFKLPNFVMKLMMGEQADLVIYGQRVLPHKLITQGFEFQYPEIGEALADIYS
ncbi:TIGR01777 family oxidoreductase [Psychrobium sp. MM17-31]|uniref:TIGR01777 family oxidoreductase n=1 Tax=Psychrobium sp. MM17-31 TaxID=2917758 RepID=UPI001EF5B215|nr:TIGR01777 family oxidoreductase [Psychrobium sp. MM17-31]MCG7531394.1 TIGR01777 family oxidoreductase [Psychrobium sp. MM17-31]